nr:hypothetical protein CFP56_29951 [Quercus suber]
MVLCPRVAPKHSTSRTRDFKLHVWTANLPSVIVRQALLEGTSSRLRRPAHRPITRAARLDILAVHAGSRPLLYKTLLRLLAAVEVDVLDVEGVDVAGEVAQHSETDVDEQVDATASDCIDTNRMADNIVAEVVLLVPRVVLWSSLRFESGRPQVGTWLL